MQIGKISVYKYCFCYSNIQPHEKKNFISTGYEALVGTLMKLGEVNGIFPINQNEAIVILTDTNAIDLIG